MKVIHARNVREGYVLGMELLKEEGIREPSRAGEVLVMPVPVTTVYLNPCERVLLNPERDANPFFHFMEGIWMLAGSQDPSFLDRFVGDFSKRFAQSDGNLWGAYGWRWRHHFRIDQLHHVIDLLKKDPATRRAAIAMWDPRADLDFEASDEPIKDIPCNTHIYFRILDHRLYMMVCCRSNDIIWGCYGANAVHMSMLHEFLASALGAELGEYRQVSFNFHAYVDVFNKHIGHVRADHSWLGTYSEARLPLVTHPLSFLEECEEFIWPGRKHVWINEVFPDVAIPMEIAHDHYKHGEFKHALTACNLIKAEDWRVACTQWINRRLMRKEQSVETV